MKASVNPDRSRCLQTGVTLVELVISIVVLSIAVVALVTSMSTSVGRGSNILVQDRAIQLAQAYLDEIMGKPYDDDTPLGGVPAVVLSGCSIGAESGESRANFDDVDDYNGLSESPPRSQTSGVFSSYEGYRVDVEVTCAGDEVGVSLDNAKRIDVRITGPAGVSMLFTSYRGNF